MAQVLKVNEIFVRYQDKRGAVRLVRWEALLDTDPGIYWTAREMAAMQGYRVTDALGNLI